MILLTQYVLDFKKAASTFGSCMQFYRPLRIVKSKERGNARKRRFLVPSCSHSVFCLNTIFLLLIVVWELRIRKTSKEQKISKTYSDSINSPTGSKVLEDCNQLEINGVSQNFMEVNKSLSLWYCLGDIYRYFIYRQRVLETWEKKRTYNKSLTFSPNLASRDLWRTSFAKKVLSALL